MRSHLPQAHRTSPHPSPTNQTKEKEKEPIQSHRFRADYRYLFALPQASPHPIHQQRTRRLPPLSRPIKVTPGHGQVSQVDCQARPLQKGAYSSIDLRLSRGKCIFAQLDIFKCSNAPTKCDLTHSHPIYLAVICNQLSSIYRPPIPQRIPGPQWLGFLIYSSDRYRSSGKIGRVSPAHKC